MIRRALASFFLGLVLAGPLAAQEPPQQQGPPPAEDRLAAVRATYAPEGWRQSGARLRALDPGLLELAGWERRALEIDPRAAEATLTLAPAGREPAALVRLALHPDAAAARRALLVRLGSVQAKLAPEPGALDAAFAAREGGKLRLFLGLRGDATVVVQRIGPGGALEAVARLAEQALLAAPLLRKTEARPTPRLLFAGLAPAPEEGAGLPLRLELDPAGPQAAHVAFEGPLGVSVVRAADGSFRVHGAAPGPLTLRALACSSALQAAPLELRLEVPPR
jgi:hypothetical protein